ncbi:hypothetical protein ES703_20445 [subsurface metagenome]
MVMIDINDDDNEGKAETEYDYEQHHSIGLAEARIKQALLRYEVAVRKSSPPTPEEKVRL